ncbi:5-3 exonuclease family protein [Corallococcus coralloides DSM 2259]|uniref:5-3 exonuclease family protein n=1 Tax=Corallococcus coralloides (strain ATCC 25202 / DSM 2259 / NBRC 100086 / M2) TaxID=1144275 RepID=H8MT51_CORCM|nr:5'-3' exonuclease H3TH domain-containing protein [Corallococcus coralloides]AFE09942.1 5-3 exonuclease family protein [Corallococcus coralloides DSM 2259]
MRLHLVDGTYELYRAHFSPRPGTTAPDGRDVKATAGVMDSLLALLHDEQEAVTHVAVAFDNPIRSFRNALFAGYKGDEGVPPELRAQFDLVEEAVAALGVRVWSMKDQEADDALATGAARWAGEVEQVRLLTPDKDLGQCVRGQRVVQVDRRQQKVVDADGVKAKLGVAPESVPDLLALMGDDADGIPGLPGFGAKGAAAVLQAYGHLESIPDDAAEWTVKVRGADKLAATLKAHREDARLYRTLATLVEDAPLPGTASLADLEWKGVPEARFKAFCEGLGLKSLQRRPKRWAA